MLQRLEEASSAAPQREASSRRKLDRFFSRNARPRPDASRTAMTDASDPAAELERAVTLIAEAKDDGRLNDGDAQRIREQTRRLQKLVPAEIPPHAEAIKVRDSIHEAMLRESCPILNGSEWPRQVMLQTPHCIEHIVYPFKPQLSETEVTPSRGDAAGAAPARHRAQTPRRAARRAACAIARGATGAIRVGRRAGRRLGDHATSTPRREPRRR